jgi:opacity protein-like surface antigen
MRQFLIAAALVAVALPAFAQSQMNPPANSNAQTPAVNSPNSPPNPGAPVAGANSFTEGQAKSRIEANGFTNVSDLKKDDAGVWRGKASKNNQSMDVSVDFQGNVVGR